MKTRDIQLDQLPGARSLAKKSALLMGEYLGKLVLTLAALLAVMLALIYPIQRDYYRRVYVQESFKHATQLASAVQDYYHANQRYPQSLGDLPGIADHPIEVQAIAFDAQTGVIRIHVADAPRDEDAFELVPSVDATWRITHACRSVNIPDEFVPRDCAKVQAK